MNPFKILIISAALWLAGIALLGGGGGAIPQPTTTAPPVYNTVDILTPEQTVDRLRALQVVETTTTAPAQIPPVQNAEGLKCEQWLPTAVQAGWPDNRQVLAQLGAIMWRESRCQPTACAPSDSDRTSENGKVCRDYGLVQGNWYAHHKWWADLGITAEDMFDPYINLHWAWLLYSGREAQGKCGWQPWALSCG